MSKYGVIGGQATEVEAAQLRRVARYDGARDTARAMSQENVEIVRRGIAAFNRHDFDAAVEDLDPEVEWHQITQLPDRAVYRGRAEVRKRLWTEQLIEQFGDAKLDVDEFVDAGDHVVLIGHVVGHGGASGLEFRLRLAAIFEMRDGKVVRVYDAAGPSQPAQRDHANPT